MKLAAPAAAPSKVIASIEDLGMINKILTHLGNKLASAEPRRLPETRAPAQAGLFD